MDPDDIVEQQIVAIAGRQALMRKPRPADHDGPEFADLRMDTQLMHLMPPVALP
jgi:hypothetical protein